jgi:hypothetical protein
MSDTGRSLAGQELSVPPTSDMASTRTALLKRLRVGDHLLSERELAAASLLGMPSLLLTPDAKLSAAEFRQADLDRFRESYWKLAPAERRARWLALRKQPYEQDQKHWLLGLEPGLDVTPIEHDEPRLQELSELVRELFLLSARSRTARQMQWLADQTEVRSLWSLGQKFSQADPDTAALVPALFAELPLRGTMPYEVEGLSSEALEAIAEKKAAKAARREREDARHKRLFETSSSPSGEGSNWWKWSNSWVVAVVLIVGVRGCAAILRSKSTTTPPPMYQQPVEIKMFTDEEIRACQQYDPKSNQPPPPRYGLWRAIMGRKTPTTNK